MTGILGAILWAATIPLAQAQSSLPEEGGFQPNRQYLGLLPWEAIDTGSNNVILTFTDLALPGNGGRELRFDRVFTNQVVQPPDGPQWRFGIAGVPMRVVERGLPRGPLPAGNIAAERHTTPYFPMLDGSRLETTYVQPPVHTDPATLRLVRTTGFWTYDRDTRILRMPDGLSAEYDGEGRLVRIWDVHHAGQTNRVTLAWSPQALEVVQALGNGESRVVHVALDGPSGLPTSLDYAGRLWLYQYDALGYLAEVVLPGGSSGGPGWRYRYSADPLSIGKIVEVTTPHGGVVEYEYADRQFRETGSDTLRKFNVLAARRTRDGGAVLGEWTFEHVAQSDDAVDQTDVTLPSGTVISFVYGAASDPNVLAGSWLLRTRLVRSPDGTIVEEERRDYAGVQLRAARSTEPWYVPRLTRRTVSRSGQTHSTDYAYSTSVQPHFHDYHNPVRVTERGPAGERVTALAYDHLAGPHVLGLLRTRSTEVGGMVATRSWAYDPSTGFRTRETAYGIATTYAPDAFGNVASATKANGTVTSYTYSWGVTKDTLSSGATVERAINPDGTVASERSAGRLTEHWYDDPRGRRTRTQPPGATLPVSVAYDDAARTVTTRRGTSSSTTAHDGFGRAIEMVDSTGVRVRVVYDAEGRKTFQSHPFEQAELGTTLTYDSLNRVTQEVNPDGTSRTRQYDDARGSVTRVDEEGRSVVAFSRGYGHPDDARVVEVVDAEGQSWEYGYDAIGHLVRVLAPTGHARTWQRDTRGLVTAEIHPESGLVTYAYDAAGVLKRKVDARGSEFVYTHDDSDRVIRVTTGSNVTTIAYEPGSDRRVAMSNGSVSTVFEYDAAGRLAHRRDVIGAFVFDSRYAYDGNDRLVAITYPTGRIVGFDRDGPEGRVARVFEAAAGRDYAFGMTYHPSGGLAGYTAGNGTVTRIAYHPARYWVERISSGQMDLAYSAHDGVGNILSIDDSRGPDWTQVFAYDPLDRLQGAVGPYGTVSYAYDPHGNRRTTAGATYVHDADTLRLVSQNGVPFAYDAGGNLTSTPSATFAYTPENRVATVTAGGGTTGYLYDADGWRARKASGADTTFYLRGPSGELLTEWRTSGKSSRARDYIHAGSHLLGSIDRPVRAATCGGQSIPDGSATTVTIASGATGSVTFEGSACRRVSAVITASTLPNCSVFYNKLSILNPDGSVLASSGNVCAGAIVGPVDLPVSGTYTIVVDPYGTHAGQATLAVHDVVDVTGPAVFGQAINASLTTPGQRGVWTFTGQRDQRVSASIGASTVTNCSVFYNRFRIVSGSAPDGPELRSFGGLCAGAIVEPVTLPATGVYTVVVDPHGSWTGQLAMTVYDVVDVTGPMTFGAPVTAALTTPGQRGYWRVSGLQNQRISVVINASTVTNCSVFYNRFMVVAGSTPEGTSLGNVGGVCAGAMIGPLTLSADGTYTVVVDPSGSWTGHVTVTAHDVVDLRGTITVNGPPASASLNVPGQRAVWTFNAHGGQQVRGIVNASTFSTCLHYHLAKLVPGDNPDATPAGGATGNLCPGTMIGPVTAPSTGTYALVVDPAGGSTGSVTVRVIDPVVLVNDIAPPQAVTVPPAARVTVRLVGTPGNARDWVALASAGSANNAYLAWQYVPAAGTLTFTMPSTPGTYEFRLFLNNGYARMATSAPVRVQ